MKLFKVTALATLFTLTIAAAATADPLGQTSQPTPLRAYRGQAIWSVPGAGKSFTLMLGGKPLPVTSSKHPVEADLSRGPDGSPAILVAAGRALELVDPATGAKRTVATTKTPATSPVIWGSRLAWVEGTTVYTATIGHKGVRTVSLPGKPSRVWELGLFGQRLAISLNSGHVESDQQVWLQELDGTRRQLIRKVTSGEADRNYLGLSFDGGALYFAQVCSGDPSGCAGHGTAFRYRSGKVTTATVPLDLSGFAQASGQSYWVTENFGSCTADDGTAAPCGIERSTLQFG